MADHKQSATAVLDAQISEAEAKAMSPEEKKFFDAALESLDREQQARPSFLSVSNFPLRLLLALLYALFSQQLRTKLVCTAAGKICAGPCRRFDGGSWFRK
jgi:hypothetical protein